MYLQFCLLECIEEHQTLVEIFLNGHKTKRIAPLMANLPPATSTTMHSRLILQDRKPSKFLTNNVI